MNRREILGAIGASMAPWSTSGCRPRDRALILESLVREVVVRMARDVLADTARLDAAARALDASPGAARRRAAQGALKSAALAWKRAFAFRDGPFAESLAFQRAAFWPARPASMERVLGDGRPIDERRIEAAGVDAKGLFALEYLLFDPELGETLEGAAGGNGARAGRYARELARNALGYAARMRRLLGDGAEYGARLARDGRHGVQLLVAQSIDSTDVLIGKLDRVARAGARKEPRAAAVEGYFSGTSLAIARAILRGTTDLYRGGPGGGLSHLVAAVSKPIDEHVRAEFARAASSLEALRMPLEAALDADPAAFRAAGEALRSLKHFLEVEMAAALDA